MFSGGNETPKDSEPSQITTRFGGHLWNKDLNII